MPSIACRSILATFLLVTPTAAAADDDGFDAPVTPREFMTPDGTLYVDRSGAPWMVYAHEWVQKVDGTMEAIPLTRDLAAAGEPIHLFKASGGSERTAAAGAAGSGAARAVMRGRRASLR